jgi:broad specificity polyphosphatase/5'/3'-nucleotidase SurE
MAIPADAYGLSGADRALRLGSRCLDAARVAGAIVAVLLERGFPAEVDLLNVNMPAEVSVQTPRRVTAITRARYGSVFAPSAPGQYRHRFRGYAPIETDAQGDMEIVRRGMVSIAPVRLDFSCPLPESLRAALETGER